MFARDFVFWLQGYFELTQGQVNWDERTQNLVLCHLQLVKDTPAPGYKSEMVVFLGWLESAIEFGASVEKIQERLNGIFQHVIDPATPGNSSQQNYLHHGYEDGARC